MKHWIVFLSVGFLVPMMSSAQNHDAKQVSLEDIKKTLKRSILEDYRHGEKELFWSVFSSTAIFVDGRSMAPDVHDLTRNRKQETARRQILAKRQKDPQRDVFFRDVNISENNEAITVKMELVFHYFGGNRLEGRIYSIQRTEEGWAVDHIRRWVIHEAMGPDIRTFDSLYFKHADAEAKKALENETLDLHTRLTYLIRAKWMNSAFLMAKQATEKTPKSAYAWRSLGALAFEVSQFSLSKKAISTALKLSPDMVVPALLKP